MSNNKVHCANSGGVWVWVEEGAPSSIHFIRSFRALVTPDYMV